MTTDTSIFEDDPILGKFIANYPSNRARLLFTGGAVLVAIWFIVTVALWQVEDSTAATITVIVLGLATLGVGWYITHLWNREIVLYERGFTYREGSDIAYIFYYDVATIRQKGERVAYFGGLLRRAVYKFTVKTVQGDVMVLDNLYRRLDHLTLRLEQEITRALRSDVERKLAQGERVAFGEMMAVSRQGLHQPGQNGHDLPWSDFSDYRVENGRLTLISQNGEWHSVRLADVDNLRLLIELLQQEQHEGNNER